MCGRFAIDDKVNEDITSFVVRTGRKPQDWAPGWEADYNLKPTNLVPVLIDSAKTRTLIAERAYWSLIPPWSESRKLRFPTFNARAEGLVTKATWRGPVQQQRAIVPARGYYEWTGERPREKQPWFIHRPDGGLLGFAGLYSWWADRSQPEDDPARWLLTATIITSDAVPHLAGIHDRQPVILPEDHWLAWLDPATTGDQALVDDAVRAGAGEAAGLAFHRVARFGTAAAGPELIAPVDEED